MSSSFLLHGHDTIQCAYFLRPDMDAGIDFEWLATEKEKLRQSKTRDPKHINLGGTSFLFYPYGSSSGFPFVMSNQDFKIEFGEFNDPPFFVTFLSEALWRESAEVLHSKFLDWANGLGFMGYKPESLSRVDFSFDYQIPEVDFDEDSFASRSAKDSKHRDNGKDQTFTFGKGDIVLRVYDKIAEINQQSQKTWFFGLWGCDENVWRVEWQVRKDALRDHGIRTFSQLKEGQGSLLSYLAEKHDTLRIPTTDKNRSRWPLHPVWIDLQKRIEEQNLGEIEKELDSASTLEERRYRIAISVYGYLKRFAAIQCLLENEPMFSKDETFADLKSWISKVDDPLTWESEVEKRATEMRLGKW
ncbi:hypothetical protein Ga0123461_1809 [Mariprofundus aestuarium]|uniref:Replication initiation factor n=1 Tax=Mariprofundus aestuarium TaxID=1921086 RepID=A0A2K8KZJ0_MARES|nr:hypothetical protein [Mariprofundus aestuarium]ATX80222.1 hypothetical protein Ga0123461_1809 [Mariprofundus aestuarium]